MLGQLRRPRRPYYDAAIEVTTWLTAAATHLRQGLAEPATLHEHVDAIGALVRESDRVTQEVWARLDKAFITPIDREDIYDLAVELRRVAHGIGDVARSAATYRIAEVREPAVQLADALVRACEGLAIASSHVRDVGAALRAHDEVRAVEKEADAIYTRAVGALFDGDGGLSVLEVMKWKDVYDQLEDAVDGCAHAAGAIAHAAVAQS
jgi:uncharacterized protein